MKIENSCSKILFVTVLALALGDSAYAATGNSIVYLDQENDRIIAIDRIHLATLPASKRESIISNAAQTHGKGRVQDLPKSYGAFALGRQQDSSGSLTGKTLDTEFAPLEAEPDHYQARASRHEEPCMKPLDKPEAVYFAAAPGKWAQSYNEGKWLLPNTRKFTKNTACKMHLTNPGESTLVSTGTTSYGQKKTPHWGKENMIRKNYTVAFEQEAPKVSYGNFDLSIKISGGYNWDTQSVMWYLYDDAWFSFDDKTYIPSSEAEILFSYKEVTGVNTGYLTTEHKFKYLVSGVKTKIISGVKQGNTPPTVDKEWVAGVSVFASVKQGKIWKSENAKRERLVTNFGYQENSDGYLVMFETGCEMEITIGIAKAKTTVKIQTTTEELSARGTRDFDYYCWDMNPQHYTHKGYKNSTWKVVSSATVEVGRFKVSVGGDGIVLSKDTSPGKFTTSQVSVTPTVDATM